MTVRVIARLDIKAPNVVKGIHLEGLRVLGKPETFAEHYYQMGADELLYMDAVATLYERNSLTDIIRRTSEKVFIPMCVGGGLRSLEDVRIVLANGADKVAVNTAAINRPEFISELANAFGSSTIVISLEVLRQSDGRWLCFTDCGRERTGREAMDWARQAVSLGAGEIMLTSVDREGTGKGFDTELCAAVATAVDVPVILSGGAGRAADAVCAVKEGHADAVAMASIFHYGALAERDMGAEGAPSHYGRSAINVTPSSIAEVKELMAREGVAVRPAGGFHG